MFFQTMVHRLWQLATVGFLLGCLPAQAQSKLTQLIQANAVEIPTRTVATPALYKVIESKKAILVGERHGTKEPAEFIEGVVETLLSQRKRVVLGIEVIGTQTNQYLKAGQPDSLRANWRRLFVMDGRCNASWLKLVRQYYKHPNVTLVLFDQTNEQIPRWSRDRSMAENLLAVLRQQPDAVLVTLSGNIHNQLKPYNETETMGYFLHTLPNAPFKPEQMVSVTHEHGGGTMINSYGDGMKLRQVPDKSGVFGTAVPYESYFMLSDVFPMWNSFLYTRTVTAAEEP